METPPTQLNIQIVLETSEAAQWNIPNILKSEPVPKADITTLGASYVGNELTVVTLPLSAMRGEMPFWNIFEKNSVIIDLRDLKNPKIVKAAVGTDPDTIVFVRPEGKQEKVEDALKGMKNEARTQWLFDNLPLYMTLYSKPPKPVVPMPSPQVAPASSTPSKFTHQHVFPIFQAQSNALAIAKNYNADLSWFFRNPPNAAIFNTSREHVYNFDLRLAASLCLPVPIASVDLEGDYEQRLFVRECVWGKDVPDPDNHDLIVQCGVAVRLYIHVVAISPKANFSTLPLIAASSSLGFATTQISAEIIGVKNARIPHLPSQFNTSTYKQVLELFDQMRTMVEQTPAADKNAMILSITNESFEADDALGRCLALTMIMNKKTIAEAKRTLVEIEKAEVQVREIEGLSNAIRTTYEFLGISENFVPSDTVVADAKSLLRGKELRGRNGRGLTIAPDQQGPASQQSSKPRINQYKGSTMKVTVLPIFHQADLPKVSKYLAQVDDEYEVELPTYQDFDEVKDALYDLDISVANNLGLNIPGAAPVPVNTHYTERLYVHEYRIGKEVPSKTRLLSMHCGVAVRLYLRTVSAKGIPRANSLASIAASTAFGLSAVSLSAEIVGLKNAKVPKFPPVFTLENYAEVEAAWEEMKELLVPVPQGSSKFLPQNFETQVLSLRRNQLDLLEYDDALGVCLALEKIEKHKDLPTALESRVKDEHGKKIAASRIPALRQSIELTYLKVGVGATDIPTNRQSAKATELMRHCTITNQ